LPLYTTIFSQGRTQYFIIEVIIVLEGIAVIDDYPENRISWYLRLEF